MADRTFVCICGLAPYALRSTLDTAVVDTPACRATSTIVTRRAGFGCPGTRNSLVRGNVAHPRSPGQPREPLTSLTSARSVGETFGERYPRHSGRPSRRRFHPFPVRAHPVSG